MSGAPPPPTVVPGAPPVIGPEHEAFERCLKTSFASFVHEPSKKLPDAFHTKFRKALQGLNAAGCLDRYDITQPMGPGTPLARTRVTRCLVGKPGITYKYLGLRMFAFPWSGEGAQPAYKKLCKVSQKLEGRATKHGADPAQCGFNLTLVNRMRPEDPAHAKQEKVFNMGAVAVSWHADSSLQDHSTISVYVAEHSVDKSAEEGSAGGSGFVWNDAREYKSGLRSEGGACPLEHKWG